jgi:short-chain fatty acids transporter
MPPRDHTLAEPPQRESRIARMAVRFTAFTQRWLPDAYGFVLVGTFVILGLGLLTGEPLFGRPDDPTATTGFGLVDAWGKGFWALIEFTLQMAMIIIGGYAVAVSRPVASVIARLARIPRTPRGAIVFTAAVAMVTAYLNWAFSLIFTAILAREIARIVRGVDYRAIGAMAFLGLGTVWAQGLSGSAALQVASSSSPEGVRDVVRAGGRWPDGLIPLSHTIFLWQSLLATAIIFLIAVAMAWFLAPAEEHARTAEDLGIRLHSVLDAATAEAERTRRHSRPGDFIEYSPAFTVLVVLLGTCYLARYFGTAKTGVLAAINLNTINLVLILLALLLHWRPVRLAHAVRDAASAASGVLLQFPFYGGIFGLIVYTGLSASISGWLVSVSNAVLYPPLVAVYSCLLGVFVPSGGGKWVIEAPYLIGAANDLGVDQGWMVVVYDLAEASANFLQPFWMLPTLAILGLKARDIMGYTFTMFAVCFPAVLVGVTVLGVTLPGR